METAEKKYKEWELLESYDEWLDEIHEPVKIGYMEYSASQVLKNVDPIAYRLGFFDDYLPYLEIDDEEIEWMREV